MMLDYPHNSGRSPNVEVAGTIVECLMENHVVVFDYSTRWAAAMDKAVELSQLTQKKGVVVLIGSQSDSGYQKAHKLIYSYDVPLELNSLRQVPVGI
jgi:hypothetical protein